MVSAMKYLKFVLQVGLAGVVTALTIGPALADPRPSHRPIHNGHHGPNWTFSVGPLYRPWVYPPYYYDPFFYRQRWNDRPIIIEQPAPQIYIEQAQAYPQPAPQQDTNNYWYFCDAAQAYFPYVKECPSGWQRVTPQPPPPQ